MPVCANLNNFGTQTFRNKCLACMSPKIGTYNEGACKKDPWFDPTWKQ